MTPKSIEQVDYNKTFTIPGWGHKWIKDSPMMKEDNPGYIVVTDDIVTEDGMWKQRHRLWIANGTLVIETTKVGE